MIDRIAVLGGSSVYTPEFILAVISRNLCVGEIALVGRSARKLKLVSQFCQRLMDRSGYPCKIIGTTDLEEGVAGAKYVLNNIRVGGMGARVRDEGLPPRMGMIGDEALGAGGVANALRTLPVVLDYARRIAAVSPDATFINLTHPMGACVEALAKHSPLRVVGVCDSARIYVRRIAALLSVPEEDLKVDYFGLNQMGWIQDVRVKGRSQMSRVLDRLDGHTDDEFDLDVIALFHMIPTRRLSLYFHKDVVLKQQRAMAQSRSEALQEAEERILRLYEDEQLLEIPDLTRARNAVWYEETIVPLIDAMESREGRDIVLCVRNEGAIRDLGDDCSVEIPVRVNASAIKQRKVGSCPRFLRGLFLAAKESDRLAVEAVVHKSYEFALQALTINPFVPSLDAARQYLDRIRKEERIELH